MVRLYGNHVVMENRDRNSRKW